MKHAALFMALLGILPATFADEPAPPKTPSILLLTQGQAGKGLQITIDGPLPLPADRKLQFQYRVTNLLEEEVFVEIPECAHPSVHFEEPNGGIQGGGGAFTIFPDNLNLLKRLHASSYKGDKCVTCGCATTTVKAKIQLPDYATPQGKLTARFYVTGFYRANGKRFAELLELPIALAEK